MIEEGLELMVVGMGVVLLFLVLLVWFMNLSGAFFTKFSHLFPEGKPPAPSAPRKPVDAEAAAKLAIAVAAAYRKRRGS